MFVLRPSEEVTVTAIVFSPVVSVSEPDATPLVIAVGPVTVPEPLVKVYDKVATVLTLVGVKVMLLLVLVNA
jgi:hypothetical protein